MLAVLALIDDLSAERLIAKSRLYLVLKPVGYFQMQTNDIATGSTRFEC